MTTRRGREWAGFRAGHQAARKQRLADYFDSQTSIVLLKKSGIGKKNVRIIFRVADSGDS